MRLLPHLLPALLLGSSLFAASLDRAAPEDTLVFVQTPNLGKLLEQAAEGPFAGLIAKDDPRWLEDPSVEALKDILAAKNLREIAERLPVTCQGPAAFIVADETQEDWGSSPRVAVLMTWTGDEETLQRLLEELSDEPRPDETLPEGQSVRTWEETYRGHTLHVEEVSCEGTISYINGFARLDNLLVLGHPVSFLRDTIDRLTAEEASLASVAHYRTVADLCAGDQLSFFVNIPALMPLFNEGFDSGFNAAVADNPMLANGAERVRAALALESLGPLYLTLNTEKTHPHLRAGLLFHERKGLVRLLAYTRSTPPNLYVPTDAISASRSAFSFGEFWQVLKDILFQCSPEAGQLLDAHMESLRQQTHLDIEQGLFHALGDQLTLYSTLRPNAEDDSVNDTVYIVSLRNAQAFSQTLYALLDLFPHLRQTLETKDYAGATLYQATVPIPDDPTQPGRFSFAIAHDQLYVAIAADGALERALDQHNLKTPGLWSEPLFNEGLRLLPPNPNETGYGNLQLLHKSLMALLEKTLPYEEDEDSGLQSLLEVLESSSLPYISLSNTYLREDGFYVELLLLPTDKASRQP